MSCPTGADVGKMVTNKEVPNNPDRRFVGPKPKNVFVVNDESDAAHAIKWLNKRFVNAEGGEYRVLLLFFLPPPP